MPKIAKTLTIPGAIDLHVHFREPGSNKAETFAAGSRAALSGGFVLVCDMPNNPGNPTWSLARLEDKHRRIKKSAYIPVATYAGSQPESDNLNELEQMAKISIGLKLYTDSTTGNDREYKTDEFKEIVKVWHQVAPTRPIMLHAGKANLEELIQLIVKQHRHQLHVCHVSDPEDVRIISKYKSQKWPLSCGVCPHHLLMTSHHRISQGWFARMKPPLVRQDKAEELLTMLANGQIDIIETDHAPHSIESKMLTETENPDGIDDPAHRTCFGVPGIEFALPLLFYQMKRGRITLERIIEATSTKPAEIISIKLSKKTRVTWNMEKYRIDNEKTQAISGSGWTPYLGFLAIGKVKKVVIAGQTIMDNGKLIKKYPQVITARAAL